MGTVANVISGPVATVKIDLLATPTTDLGYTKGAVTIQPEVDQSWITVDQECPPVRCVNTNKAWILSIPFAEATIAAAKVIEVAWDVTASALHTLLKAPTARNCIITQPGAGGTTRMWTFKNLISTDYGEHSTEDGQPVVIVAKFKVLVGTGMSVAEA